MPIDAEIPTHLNMRIDPKLRYLADLAARARNMSLTDYIEEAIWESFRKVSLDQYPELSEAPEVYELSPTQRRDKFRKRQETVSNPLSEVGERLWADHPFTRIQLLVVAGLDHLLSAEQRRIWDHVFAAYATNGRLSTKRVIEKWDRIKHHIWLKSQHPGKARGDE